ncbi:MAG: serine protease [Symploca sp. SIO2C1]|nr:serine protease [Symploca sp. SIO2C1]
MSQIPNRRVQTRNPRNFTVKICHAVTEEVVGTGFVVSTDGKIVTCRHVVRDAIGYDNFTEGVIVNICFPQTKDPDLKNAIAKVTSLFAQADDDVVLLELESSFLPVEVTPAILATAQESEGNKFVSFGYRRLQDYQGLPARGEIVGYTELPANRILHTEPVMLSSEHIDSGMSGAAVLDQDRDRVIGIIAETWDSAGSAKDSKTAFAVDCLVLSLEPICLQIEGIFTEEIDTPIPPTEGQRTDETIETGMTQPKRLLDDMPAPLSAWVGREDLLQALSEAWLDPDYCIIGLIGFGGEGKTSIAARWLTELLHHPSLPQPDGVFWWDFNQKPYVDEFFSKVFESLDIREIDHNLLVSVDAKAEIIRSLKGRYLFILDGIEVVQHQSGDDYGLLTNKELCSFLRSFAEGNHQSFCLVTSRAPLLDLLDYTTYTEREVNPLSIQEGSTLLKKLGVKGKNAELEQVVKDWGGYALMLSLIAAYLNKRGGEVKRLRGIPAPATDESLEDRVQRILDYYDKNLKEAEREMLTVLSAFRLPVPLEEYTFRRAIFEGKTGAPGIPRPLRYDWIDRLFELIQKWCDRILKRNLSEYPRLDRKLQAPVDTLSHKVFKAMITRLIKTRVLRKDSQTVAYYSLQPLIRAHYLKEFTKSPHLFRQAHQRIAEYYLQISGPIPEQPRRENILPVLEAVHHLCQAQEFDQAWYIFGKHLIDKDGIYLLSNKLGAWDIERDLYLDFFPDQNFTQEPQVTRTITKATILHNTGLAFNNLGSPTNSKLLYERSIAKDRKREDWIQVGTTQRNLTYLYVDFGDLKSATTSIQQALSYLARSSNRADNKILEYRIIVTQASIDYLKGDMKSAGQSFQLAEDLLDEVEPDYLYLCTGIKIGYANYLRKLKQLDQAREVIAENLKICRRNYWLARISSCYRSLGDLCAEEQQHETAKQHYQEALKIIRNTAARGSLIKTLSARGRWGAKYMQDVETAQTDLTEALDYALSAGFCLYEADIRVGLAWMYYTRGDVPRAKEEAERARQMSEEMEYHWGQVDAMEVLEQVELASCQYRN